MGGRFEVLKRVRVRRILAAPDVAAGKTDAKLVPTLPEGGALLAAGCTSRHPLQTGGVCAWFGDYSHNVSIPKIGVLADEHITAKAEGASDQTRAVPRV
jgi:hypothetical protein